MIPVSFDPLGTGGAPLYEEISDFQSYNGSAWVPADPKANIKILLYPCRWHSNDPDPSHWFLRIIIYIQSLNQTRPVDFTISMEDGWLIQPKTPSLEGSLVAILLLHNGINTLV